MHVGTVKRVNTCSKQQMYPQDRVTCTPDAKGSKASGDTVVNQCLLSDCKTRDEVGICCDLQQELQSCCNLIVVVARGVQQYENKVQVAFWHVTR